MRAPLVIASVLLVSLVACSALACEGDYCSVSPKEYSDLLDRLSKLEHRIDRLKGQYKLAYSHSVTFDKPYHIPPCSTDKVASPKDFTFASAEHYRMTNTNGDACYADIGEFAAGALRPSIIAENARVFMRLHLQVHGHPDNTQTTWLAALRNAPGSYEGGCDKLCHYDSNGNGVYDQPRLLVPVSGSTSFPVHGRKWGDNYLDQTRVEFASDRFLSGFPYAWVRLVNLGPQQVEVSGVSLEYEVPILDDTP